MFGVPTNALCGAVVSPRGAACSVWLTKNLGATARPDVRVGIGRIIVQIQVEGSILRTIVGIASHIGHTPPGKNRAKPR